MVFQAQSPDSSSRAVADLPLFVVVESEYTNIIPRKVVCAIFYSSTYKHIELVPQPSLILPDLSVCLTFLIPFY
jgi:hypothetical protein